MTISTHAVQMAVVPALLAACLAPASAAAQEMTGHEHHRMAMAAPAPVTAARPMDVQPVIEDLTLTDASGRALALDDVLTADVPVFVNFIFTTCTTICPVMSAGFAQLESRLAADDRRVKLVSISIDPEVDTPARLREYAAKQGAGSSWVFLTGTQAASEAAQRAFGAFRGSKESHTAATFVRRSHTSPWERLDGLASGEALLKVYAGNSSSHVHD